MPISSSDWILGIDIWVGIILRRISISSGDNWESLFDSDTTGKKYNKNLILLYMREMTSLSTKEIRISLKRFKRMYDGILGGFLE